MKIHTTTTFLSAMFKDTQLTEFSMLLVELLTDFLCEYFEMLGQYVYNAQCKLFHLTNTLWHFWNNNCTVNQFAVLNISIIGLLEL